jgi:RND family efflux transporter MFP subunit
MSEKRTITKWIGPGLLVLAILLAVIFVKTKPTAERKPMASMVPVVITTELSTTNAPVQVSCLGTVIADDEAALEAEVSGRIVEMNPDLVAGGFVKKGDWLLTIDPSDYELAVERARAALLKAESSLMLEEGQQSVAKHEMSLIGGDEEIDDDSRDLMLRVPQLKSAQADLKTAQANLATAELDLKRTRITAPFDAVVESLDVSEGDNARTGKTLMTLAATGRWFVRATLPVSDLQNFPNIGNREYRAEVQTGGAQSRSGTLYKLLPGLSEQGRMARVLVTVDNPLSPDAGRPLLLDEVVPVTLFGEIQENVCLIERRHLRSGPAVWMVDAEDHLHICPVEVVQSYADRVMIQFEFSNDWKLMTSSMDAPVDGMKVRTPESPEAGREK